MLILLYSKYLLDKLCPNAFDIFEKAALIIEQARQYVGRSANLTMSVTCFEVGRMIVDEEQGGQIRAAYGKDYSRSLSAYLNERDGKGHSVSILTNARKFNIVYSPSISQAMLTKLETKDMSQKSQAMPGNS